MVKYIVTLEWVLEDADEQEGTEIICITGSYKKALAAFTDAVEDQKSGKFEGEPIKVCGETKSYIEAELPVWETWQEGCWGENHVAVRVMQAEVEPEAYLLEIVQKDTRGLVTVMLASPLTDDQKVILKAKLKKLRDSHEYDEETDDAIVEAACDQVFGPGNWCIPGSGYIEF